MIGRVIYIEKDEPETVRTHDYTAVLSIIDGLVVLSTDNGPRTHKMSEYIEFGLFPMGTGKQPYRN